MTGHLVLSTLHTNDAISSAMRLMDMGVESFLAASSLRAIVAQRLMRKLCDECAVPHIPDKVEVSWLERYLDKDVVEQARLRRPVGCHNCNQSGFRGRLGVFEMLMIKDDVADALRRGDSSLFIERAKQQPGFKLLIVSALEHAIEGATAISEVLRVAQELEEPETNDEHQEGAVLTEDQLSERRSRIDAIGAVDEVDGALDRASKAVSTGAFELEDKV